MLDREQTQEPLGVPPREWVELSDKAVGYLERWGKPLLQRGRGNSRENGPRVSGGDMRI